MSKSFTLKTSGQKAQTDTKKDPMIFKYKRILYPLFLLVTTGLIACYNLEFVPFYILMNAAAILGYFIADQSNQKLKHNDIQSALTKAMTDQDNTIQMLFNVTEESFSLLNNNIEKILGYSADDKIIRNNIFFIEKETEVLLRSKLHRQSIESCPKFSLPLDLIDSKGESRHFIANVNAIVNKMDEIEQVFINFIDISQAKKELKFAEQHVKDLQGVIQQYKQFQREMEEMSVVLTSNDLKQPIRNIICYIQMLEKRYANNLDANGKDFIKYIEDASLLLNSMVDDMVAFSTLGSNSTILKKMKPAKLITYVAEELKRKHKVDFELNLSEMPVISADMRQMKFLFQNLIDNAIKYRSDKPLKISINCIAKNRNWEFSVEDNGIGIQPEYANKIFDIYRRLHSTGKYTGSGIGLAMCKKIITNHNGLIWLNSKGNGSGATFTFNLPMTAADQNTIIEKSTKQEVLVGSRA